MTHTLFGYDRLATGLHKGNVGIRTGSTARSAGKTHLFNSSTQRTACGQQRQTMMISLVPDYVTESSWHVRVALCNRCRKHLT
jgi:hypothetical protein